MPLHRAITTCHSFRLSCHSGIDEEKTAGEDSFFDAPALSAQRGAGGAHFERAAEARFADAEKTAFPPKGEGPYHIALVGSDPCLEIWCMACTFPEKDVEPKDCFF